MPNRIIKESICRSDSIDQLSWFEEVFFYRLMVNCDDYGRYDARPRILKANLFPLKDGVTLAQIEKSLNKLSTAGMVQVYEYDQKPYLQLVTWEKHQNIRNHKSKYPAPPEIDINCDQLNSVAINCDQLQAIVPVIQSESESESESNTYRAPEKPPAPESVTKKKKFVPPTLEEIEAYCRDRGNSVDAKTFYDYFSVSNWIDSKGKPVLNWKQKIITWESQSKGQGGRAPKQDPQQDPGKYGGVVL